MTDEQQKLLAMENMYKREIAKRKEQVREAKERIAYLEQELENMHVCVEGALMCSRLGREDAARAEEQAKKSKEFAETALAGVGTIFFLVVFFWFFSDDATQDAIRDGELWFLWLHTLPVLIKVPVFAGLAAFFAWMGGLMVLIVGLLPMWLRDVSRRKLEAYVAKWTAPIAA